MVGNTSGMNPDRMQQIEDLYHAALERGPEQRAALLSQTDPELRREVESLLAQGGADSPADNPMARPALQVAADLMADSSGSGLEIGSQLGRYQIEGLVGAGGMGKVYKARDTVLGRYVAVKTSNRQFGARFEREARAISALNHPHICQLHDVGPNYLVMELVEGVPLQGPMPVARAIEYASQILDALEEAHSKGIIHRDLKPGNILLGKQGIKLLDFGLAKSGESEGSEETATIGVMGTPAYMAPEQWAGKRADARSDLYAFGCMLYEMLTGQRVTRHSDAPLQREKVEPAALEAVLRKCLAVEPAERWQSAAEVKSALLIRPRATRKYGLAAAAALVLIASTGFLWQRAQAKPPLTDKDVLVLADFTNTTGDAVFDLTLRQALAFQLEQSPFLKIMEDERVIQTLQLMGRAPGERITDQIAKEICVRAGEKAMIGGSIAGLDKTYAISLQATDCQTGAILAREQAQAEDKDHVLKAVAQAAIGMRAKLGESLSSIPKPDQLDPVTTTSLEALQSYSLGYVTVPRPALEKIPFLQRAVELDPNFATAYRALGNQYATLGVYERRDENFRKAFALRDRVSERERLLISGLYFQRVTGELNKAVDAFQLLAQSYPRDFFSYHQLGLIYSDMGEDEKAIPKFQQAIRLSPSPVSYYSLIATYRRLDRFDEAKALADEFFRGKRDAGSNFHMRLLELAYVQGDLAAVEKEIRWYAGKPEEFQSLSVQAANAEVLGQRNSAKELRREAVVLARRRDLTNIVSEFPGQGQASNELFGKCGSAHNREEPLLVRALCGDTEVTQQLIDSAINPIAAQTLYLRGLNFLRARKGAEAAAEFQKLLDHKGANWGPYYPVSYVGLARAAVLAGDTARAKRAYQNFFALWKDADKDIPLLIAAKNEYVALN